MGVGSLWKKSWGNISGILLPFWLLEHEVVSARAEWSQIAVLASENIQRSEGSRLQCKGTEAVLFKIDARTARKVICSRKCEISRCWQVVRGCAPGNKDVAEEDHQQGSSSRRGLVRSTMVRSDA